MILPRPGIHPLAARVVGRGELAAVDARTGEKLLQGRARRCWHCRAIVILNPERRRPRAACRDCGGYVCDDCRAACWPAEQGLLR